MQFKQNFLSFTLVAITALHSITAFALSNEDALIEAKAAFDKKNEKVLIKHLKQMKSQDYFLSGYADYWLMLLKIKTTDDVKVSKFIQQYSAYPFADRVRGQWLKKLGQAKNWSMFMDEYPNYALKNTEVKCYALQAQVKYAGKAEATSLLKEAKPLWFSGRSLPNSCGPVFNSMHSKGILSDADVWARFRLAITGKRTSLAKSIVGRYIGKVSSKQSKLVRSVVKNPKRALQKNTISMRNKFERELAIFAVEHVARKDLALAVKYWKKIEKNYKAEARSYGWSRLALRAAMQHNNESLAYFDKAKNTELNDEQHAWKVRAALRQKNWAEVYRSINAMSEKDQEALTWQYWKARALKEQGDVPGANAIFVAISKEHEYYGMLAKEELGDVISAVPTNFQVTEAEVATVANLPGIKRAIALNDLGLRTESLREWAAAIKGFDDRALIAASEAASRVNWLYVSINTSNKTKAIHNFNLRFPTPHRQIMQSYADENKLDLAWVYGLIRQESRFIRLAKSRVGASGLMQVMPATARWIAKRLNVKGFKRNMIHELDTNVKFGTHYMRYTMDRMEDQQVMATAAYNAGPGRPKKWAANVPLDADIYTENIPFTETRRYVKKVMANAAFYSQRLGSKKLSVKQRMGFIPAYGDKAL